MPRRLIIPAFALCVAGAAALAQPVVSERPPPGILTPTAWTHHLAFPESDGVRSVAFAPDSRTLYVHITVPTIDAWSIAIRYWPEALGSVLVLLTLVALFLALRTARHRQSPGAPCCRRCHYDLSPQIQINPAGGPRYLPAAAGVVCPECGVDLVRRPPQRGRTLRRRLVPLLLLWLLAAAGYGSMHLAGVPRSGYALHWLDLTSAGLADLATRRNIARLTPLIRRTDRILEIDLATGRTLRTVATRRSVTFNRIAVSPDGKSLFLAGPAGGDVDRISTRTGRRQGTLRLPDVQRLDPGTDLVVGFSTDGRTAYIQWLERTADPSSGITAWNLDTGLATLMVRTPTYVRQSPGVPDWPIGRHFYTRPGGPFPRFVSLPGFMESFPTKKVILRLHGRLNGLPTQFEPAPQPDFHARPVVSTDGGTLYYVSRYGRELVGLDLESGEPIGVLHLGMGGQSALAASPDTRLIAIPVYESVLVRDTAAKRWVASLTHPTDVYAPAPYISPDGRWVAAVCQKTLTATGQTVPPGNPGGRFTHELTLWNLGVPPAPSHTNP